MLIDRMLDTRFWIAAAIAVALLAGDIGGDLTPKLVIIVLMMQMVMSLQGLSFSRDDLRKDSRSVIRCFVSNFGVCTLTTLACGLVFIPIDTEIWYGWVVLSSVPPAISIISLSLMMKGNRVMSVLALSVIYIVALGLTPALTYILVGGAVSPLEIFKYVLLFVAIPLLINIPIKKIQVPPKAKIVFINIMMFLLLVFSLGHNRDFVLGSPGLVCIIFLLCILKVFGVSLLSIHIMKRYGCDRDDSVVYMGFSVCKNSGLATTICLILLSPESSLPCVLCIVAEAIWFAVMTGYINRKWPHSDDLPAAV